MIDKGVFVWINTVGFILIFYLQTEVLFYEMKLTCVETTLPMRRHFSSTQNKLWW